MPGTATRTAAITAVALMAGLAGARADCAWSIGILEADLRDVATAAPLAADPSLPLGPDGGQFHSGSTRDLSGRAAAQAFPSGAPAGAGDLEALRTRLDAARTLLDEARRADDRSDEDVCMDAVERAGLAIEGAREAFQGASRD